MLHNDSNWSGGIVLNFHARALCSNPDVCTGFLSNLTAICIVINAGSKRYKLVEAMGVEKNAITNNNKSLTTGYGVTVPI